MQRKNSSRSNSEFKKNVAISSKLLALTFYLASSYTFSLSIVFSLLMAGRLGKGPEGEKLLAGMAQAAGVINTLGLTGLSTLYAVSIIVSNTVGGKGFQNPESSVLREEQKRDEISRILKNGLIVSLPISVLVALITYFGEEILKGLGQDPEIAAYAGEYLEPFSLGMIGLGARMVPDQILIGSENARLAMILGQISLWIGTALAYVFAFLMNMGLRGIAWAYTIESFITFALYILALKFAAHYKDYEFFKSFSSFTSEDVRQLKNMSKIGAPFMLNIGGEAFAMFAIGNLAVLLGEQSSIAYAFGAQYYYLILILIVAFGLTNAQMIARNPEAQKHLVKPMAKYGLLTSFLTVFLFSIPFAAYPEMLTKLITTQELDPATLQQAGQFLRLMVLFAVIETLRYNMVQVCRYSKNANPIMLTVIALSPIWLGVLASYLLAFPASQNLNGLAYGIIIGVALGVLAIFRDWYKFTQSNVNAATERNVSTLTYDSVGDVEVRGKRLQPPASKSEGTSNIQSSLLTAGGVVYNSINETGQRKRLQGPFPESTDVYAETYDVNFNNEDTDRNSNNSVDTVDTDDTTVSNMFTPKEKKFSFRDLFCPCIPSQDEVAPFKTPA